MDRVLLGLGLLLTLLAVIFLLDSYRRTRRELPYPGYGYVGLIAIGVAEVLLFLHVPPVSVFFTPIAWTGYILTIDAAIYSVRGRSLLRTEPEALVWMAVLSIFLWVIFEGYNTHLVNWTYVGLPSNVYLRYLGYGWSFATIIPSMLETAELLLATRFSGGTPPPADVVGHEQHLPLSPSVEPRTRRVSSWVWIAAGLMLVIVPLVVPRNWGVYMFGLIWLGFIPLTDAVNDRLGAPSLFRDLRHGYRHRLWALLCSGAVCGFLWEFWNYWAAAKWLYIFPILQEWAIFEMPVAGFLGFPPFAVEMFAMYHCAANLLRKPVYEIQ